MLQNNLVFVKGLRNVTFLLNLNTLKCRVNYYAYLRGI